MNIEKVLKDFETKKILVIGDLILDKFMRGRVSRISPEAPVPIVDVTEEKYMPGGAGNVVNNLVSLGARVSVTGVVGADIFGEQIKGILKSIGADISGIFSDERRPTSLKTRIIAEHQQVVRADLESKKEIDAGISSKIIKWAGGIIKEVDGIIISDYGKGLITTELISSITKMIEAKRIPVVVDPQIGHFFEYKNVTSITPNVKEAGAALKTEIDDEASLLESGRKLIGELNCDSVLITRGEHGMTLFLKDGTVRHIEAVAREVYDVTGAGDTVASVFTLALTSGLGFYDSAVLSNHAAAVVVSKLGTASVTADELKKSVGGSK
ncbi:MAG: D-glycero-beta-D-manno-heptose-7-phosphate kinase [Elusimicrobia bacterium]|nr:D-glycero-beta-D-manno-heptose-7-phosphate kinase [Elusimicrobiota bacterium]